LSNRGRIAIIADAHLGQHSTPHNLRLEKSSMVEDRMVCAFEEVLVWMESRKILSLVVAGDLFDSPVITPRIISHIARIFREQASRGVHFYLLTGNHDYNAFAGNALHYLGGAYNVHVIEQPCVSTIEDGSGKHGQVLWVPWLPGKSAAASVKVALDCLIGHAELRPRLMIGHLGLFGFDYDTEAAWMQHDASAISIEWLAHVLEGSTISDVVVGHFHRSNSDILQWGIPHGPLSIFQVGALNPASPRDAGVSYGNIVVTCGTADGELIVYNHHIGAVSGIRYVRDKVDVENIGDDTITKRNWYITSCEETSALETLKLSTNPKSLPETYGAITSYVNPIGIPKLPAQIMAPAETPQEAVLQYVKQGLERQQFSGPIPGLLREALGRMHGGVAPEELFAPMLVPGARGSHAFDTK